MRGYDREASRAGLGVAVLVVSLMSCQRAAVLPADKLPPLPPPPEEQIVALVGGRPISAAQVAQQVQATRTSPKEALDALIRGEILAQEAEARGLASHQQVKQAAKQEMVRRFLAETFEKDVTPQKAVSEEAMQKAYERNKPRLVHPDVRFLHQLLLTGPPEKDAQVQALAQEVQRAAAATRTTEEFDQIAEKFRDAAKAQQASIDLQMGATSRYGMTIEEFAKAAFELKKIGDVSPVVKTRFGYHIVRYEKLTPAENVTYEQAKEKIRLGLWPEAQTRAFIELQERLVKDHQATTFPERLSALQEVEQSQP